jgi:hypothetical protein
VFRWISLNTDALVSYWEGQIDPARLCQMLKPLAAQRTMPYYIRVFGLSARSIKPRDGVKCVSSSS